MNELGWYDYYHHNCDNIAGILHLAIFGQSFYDTFFKDIVEVDHKHKGIVYVCYV